MDPSQFKQEKLDIDAKVQEFESLPNKDLAKSLLALWGTLRLDYPLPLFILDPKIIINSVPSRRDFQSSWPIFESMENVNIAVDELVRLGLAKRVRLYGGHEYVRLEDYSNALSLGLKLSNISSENLLSGAFDPHLMEVSRFFCTIYPRSGLAMMADLLVERLLPHGVWLAYVLNQRQRDGNASDELNAFLNSDQFLFFIFSLQFVAGDSGPDDVRWSLLHRSVDMQARTHDIASLLPKLNPPIVERDPLLMPISIAVSQRVQSSDDDELQLLIGILQSHLEEHKNIYSFADWISVKNITYAVFGRLKDARSRPSFSDVFQDILSFKRGPDSPDQHVPAWHDQYLLLNLLYSRRHIFDEAPKYIKVTMDALRKAAEAENPTSPDEILSRLPFLSELMQAEEMVKFLKLEAREGEFQRQSKFVVERICAFGPQNLGSAYLRAVYFDRFSKHPEGEVFAVVEQILEDMVYIWGAYCPDITLFVTALFGRFCDRFKGKEKLTEKASPWLQLCFNTSKFCRSVEELRIVDSALRLASIAVLQAKPDALILVDAVARPIAANMYDKADVLDCLFAGVVAISNDISQQESTLTFLARVEEVCLNLSRGSARVTPILAVVLLSRMVVFFKSGKFAEGMQIFRLIIVKHGRPTKPRDVDRVIGEYLPLVTDVLISSYKQNNRSADVNLLEAVLSTADHLITLLQFGVDFVAGKPLFWRNLMFCFQEYVSSPDRLHWARIYTFCARLRRAGFNDLVTKYLKFALSSAPESMAEYFEKAWLPALAVIVPERDLVSETPQAPPNGDARKKNQIKKLKSASTMNMALVGSAAAVCSIVGVVGMYWLARK